MTMRFKLIVILAVSQFAWAAAATLDTLKFSHKAHIQDIGAQCTDCHVSLSQKGKPAKAPIVAEATCKKCHDNETAAFECKICHTNADNVKPRPPVNLNTLFSHAQHVDSSKNCTPCHQGLDTAEKANRKSFPTMATCMTCHNDRKAPASCKTCHTNLANLKPVSHNSQWLRRGGHGYEARFPGSECAQCHQTSSCNQCHRGNTHLKIHSPGYEFEHGLDVKSKALNCTVCHETSRFCSRCHGGNQ